MFVKKDYTNFIVLKIKNTNSFDIKDVLSVNNNLMFGDSYRPTSIDLELHPVNELWDEGNGYDFVTGIKTFPQNIDYVVGPSNWYQSTNVTNFNTAGVVPNGATPIATQHLSWGNEDIEMDITGFVNLILASPVSGSTYNGFCLKYTPAIESLTFPDDRLFALGLFTRHTQTFYEPYLETNYDDLIQDDRNNFAEKKVNKLYLYVYNDAGELALLDSNPNVDIEDPSGNIIFTGLTTCLKTRGVYEVTVPAITGYTTPCLFTDKWNGVVLDGVNLGSVENTFVLKSQNTIGIVGSYSKDPSIFGFDFYGIKQDEKIFNTDIRKVGVIIKQAYTTQKLLQKVFIVVYNTVNLIFY